SYDSPEAEALLRAGEEWLARSLRPRRELLTLTSSASGFLVAAALLALLAPWQHHLSVSRVAVVLVVWVILERVKFPVAGGWTRPTMLVFVPMLFMLPTPIVPLFALAAMLLRGIPDVALHRAPVTMVLALVGDAWFTIGPALVIVLAGAQRFAWSHWPVYALAMVAQVLVDLTATIGRCWIGERISPRVQLPLLAWAYLVDAALAPLGLVIAAGAVARPALLLIALSPMLMLIGF